MDPCRNILLISLEDCSRHRSQIYDEVSNLAIKLILVDIPFSAVASRNIRIVVNESDSREVGVALDNRLIIWIANKLSIVISIGEDCRQWMFPPSLFFIFFKRGEILGEGGKTYWIIGVLIRYVPAWLRGVGWISIGPHHDKER